MLLSRDCLIRRRLFGSELHQDGTAEENVFVPGYGEFRTGGGGDLEALALAIPVDALDEPLPAELKCRCSPPAAPTCCMPFSP